MAIVVKVIRRASILLRNLRPLPRRAGFAAGSMSDMAVAEVFVPYAPDLALALALGSFVVVCYGICPVKTLDV